MSKAKGGRGECVCYPGVYAGDVLRPETRQQSELTQSLTTEDKGKPLVVVDVLNNGDHDLARLLEDLLVCVQRSKSVQLTRNVVVQTHKHRVNGGQPRLFVDPRVT